ncbi:uncharacterized protein PAC_15305 [Phialocephala subalpina]|uniref:NACHT domain-containing protein n=1 Tax=Phialocephala subalpina TaxID=576137 RepID=A0A1L7XK17_9HELO|nr:uncharacterized protein PAC_15305 [Phialocephala subalpina]
MGDTHGEVRALREQITSLAFCLARVDATIGEEHRQLRDAILKSKNRLEVDSSETDHITASVEMLGVFQSDEDYLRKEVNTTLLQDLSYSTLPSRYEAVPEAYPDTFEWAFQDSKEEQVSWSNLSDWLRTGNGVYWIHRKAGSGKSTLTKHILEDAHTRQYLTAWAENTEPVSGIQGTLPLCIASFFFWNSGSIEQKSQTGLLRGLLHQILSKIPELIPMAFPVQYAQAYSQSVSKDQNASAVRWSLRQLMTAFKHIIEQKSIPFNLCLIIDGLDEFDGDHEEMALLFKILAQAPNVKICLSSRPWQVFKGIFCKYPSLQLQDLTYSDIHTYVTGKFDQSAAFQRLSSDDPTAVHLLVQEIVQKAAGVFLWVRIVVTSLIQGINNRDDIEILHQRLRLLPSELKPLYDHILNDHIDPLYKPWASKAFQLTRNAREVLSFFDQACFNESEDRQFSLLDFLFAIEENLEIPSVRAFSKEQLVAKCENAAILLNVRCGGLLEIPDLAKSGPKAKIEYMHRTARDFLHSDDYWPHLLANTAKIPFNSYVSLMRSGVLWIARNRQHSESAKTMVALLYAHYADLYAESRPLQMAILDNLDRLRIELQTLVPKENFLHLAVHFGLTGYIEEKLRKMEPNIAEIIAATLWTLLKPWPSGVPPLRNEVRLLLLRYKGGE